ncbi:FKBP-type peptidyl-prolyl cis-trans isomerase [Bordetella holmesii]|uniref:Peptidyl-prolyl cis-trans isomerase n=2 Tax=Bordetella holmesii TaxID=35814 RepID=A0A158M416_9BORD|nr:FKBP-type peptidyl-prolyl cis-trans isomerase [Bordetella holmesii]AHV94004.1 FKBP-type peptidyl-prolyl cis-trans isomerase family protein [Bordetella holmesii ATCC 51541]AIT27557.1 FKBP-type peptidyl-prolyl cis-trans isomerase family protein [Bordetella holmesii 44057]EWM48149.1 FKBP-type peptidyl-prolyl cis-trans isomerase family protein [Bordetella holmesii 35009]EWM49130.1 FKBP-type peptidyl-prolyl cis-trans isomerase family protein [Bordetella holmesii 70147]AMD46372.1 peptidylprolyl i
MTVSIHPDSYLTLHYRVVLASGPAEGSVFTDTFDGRPATLQMGGGQWAPGMEAGLLGHQEDERFSFTLEPAEAYGDRNPELIQKVTRRMLAEHAGADTSFSPGDLVEFAAPNGGRYSGVLKEINDDWAMFDFNHPLAGIRLRVDVHILGVL